MGVNFEDLTIKKAHEELVKGSFSAAELGESYFQKAQEKNGALNMYLELFDGYKKDAEQADRLIREQKERVPMLTGIPLAMKDNILIRGHVASAASKILASHVASYDATVTKKLKENGAVFLGRTNMDEFAMGSSNEHSAFGRVLNPYDPSRVPGGSSGGSAAAVASGCALGALGSDTGGSIREPASFCGVVGLKPTYGNVSRYGLIALASSLDQIGPFAKTVEDAKIIYDAISGHDPKDSTSFKNEKTSLEKKNKKRIGIPYHVFEGGGIDQDVLENFKKSVSVLQESGYEVRDIELPHAKYALPVYYIIMSAEASTNLARFDGVRYGLSVSGKTLFEDYAHTRGEGFGRETRRRILMGTYVLSSGYYDAYYTKARSVRALIARDFLDAFNDASGVDCIMTPTSPTPAFKAGEKTGSPLQMYLADIFTVPANIAGIPAISVPSGVADRDGKSLPLGVQFMAPHNGEHTLFEVGEAFEKASASSHV